MAGLNWLISQFRRVLGSGHTDGMTIDKALSYPPVWHAVSKISGHVAYLPLNLHQETVRRGVKRNEKPTEHLGYRVFRVRANAYQTPFVLKRQLMLHALLVGNGYAYINRDGLMTELWPLMPDRIETHIIAGEKVHLYKPDRDERLSLREDIQQSIERSKQSGKFEVIPLSDADVFHVSGLSYDGFSGKSLLTLAARSWNLGIGAELTERSRQRKGYAGGLMLEAPDHVLTKEKDAEEFLEAFRKRHDGEENAGKTGLLTRGIKANVIQMSQVDAQFLENRKFQRQDAALVFMLEQILGDDSSVSYSSLEQKNLAYLQNCLSPWLKCIEEEADVKLLTESERKRGFYFKFNDGALLRTDKLTTANIISILRGAEVLSANDGREWFDMNPYEGGDNYDNPNTKSGRLGSSSTTAEPATSSVVQNRLKHLLKTEGKQAIDACKSSNFVAKIDTLYSKWLNTWASDIGDDAAKEHCETSKNELLACADKAKSKEELTKLVTELVASWPSKAEHLAKGLIPC